MIIHYVSGWPDSSLPNVSGDGSGCLQSIKLLMHD